MNNLLRLRQTKTRNVQSQNQRRLQLRRTRQFRSFSAASSVLPTAKDVLDIHFSAPKLTQLNLVKDLSQFNVTGNLKHFKFYLQDNVAVLEIDSPDTKVNTLNEELMSEMEQIINVIEKNDNIQAAVLVSGKKNNFIAGADIKMLDKCSSEEEGAALSRGGNELLQRIENSKKPFVAAINGSCLGGGLEVALACHHRIATDNTKTMFGLPEVQLGLLPGSGGTQRLTTKVGLVESLTMQIQGKKVFAKKAKKIGLIDSLSQPIGLGLKSSEENTFDNLVNNAIRVAKGLTDKKEKGEKKKKAGIVNYLMDTKLAKNYIFSETKKKVDKTTYGNYPAPYAIIEAIKNGLDDPKKGKETEINNFGKLTQTTASKALRSLFFASNETKKNSYGKPDKVPSKVAVLGAGLMGAGIAQVSLKNAGAQVVLKDINLESVGKGVDYIYKNLDRNVKRRAMSGLERDLLMNNLIPKVDFEGFGDIDLVIEAVPEVLSLKHDVLKHIESITKKDCIFASNTSALPITDIAKVSKRPENVIGMHYFSPVEKMKLLEIIVTDKTSEEVTAKAVEFGIKQGNSVIVVRDGPGFYTTRILASTLLEVFHLLRSGSDIDRVNKVMKKAGFPVGPVQLIDEVGIDVAKHVSSSMANAFPERMHIDGNDQMLDIMMEQNILGKKNKNGFFSYSGKKRSENPKVKEILEKHKLEKKEFKDEDIQMRIIGKMVNEAVLCLQEGILKSPTDGDVAAVFGLGFPPFTGGPFRFVDTYGVDKLVAKLQEFAKEDKRFEPCDMLVKMANENKKFYE